LKAARSNDPAKAERITQQVMQDSIDLWKSAKK
jgi:hypothetical protein